MHFKSPDTLSNYIVLVPIFLLPVFMGVYAGMSVYVCVLSWERINVLQKANQKQSLLRERVHGWMDLCWQSNVSAFEYAI